MIKMMIRLDTEAGKHRAYEGETKLDTKQHRAGDKLTNDDMKRWQEQEDQIWAREEGKHETQRDKVWQ